jgi:hypothetical protein
MRTQIIVKLEPSKARLINDVQVPTTTPGVTSPNFTPIPRRDALTQQVNHSNYPNNIDGIRNIRGDQYLEFDLYDNTPINLNFNILDISEPEKRKTNWSKTIALPRTKKNNKIFNHIFEISGDSRYNPNLRKSVIILQDGIEIMRGSMKLEDIIDESYLTLISGDFTNIFTNLGNSRLRDLDMNEWKHDWDQTSIESSWVNGCFKNGNLTITADIGPLLNFTSITRQLTTGRVQITTSGAHNLIIDDWVKITPNSGIDDIQKSNIEGDFCVVQILSSTQFVINHPFPPGLSNNSLIGILRKWNPKGEGYVYPMISWGDDTIANGRSRFPVESMQPAFYIKELWDKAFKQAGVKYESNFLNSNFFKRLILTNRKLSLQLLEEQIVDRKFDVQNINLTNIDLSGFGSQGGGSKDYQWRSFPNDLTQPQRYPFTIELQNGIDGVRPFDFNTNRWQVTDSGKYDFTFKLGFDITMEILPWAKDVTAGQGAFITQPWVSKSVTDSGDYSFSGITQFENIEVNCRLVRRSNGLTMTIGESVITFGRTEPINKDTFKNWRYNPKLAEITLEDQVLNKGDLLWVEVSYYGRFKNESRGIVIRKEIPSEPGKIWAYRGNLKLRQRTAGFFSNEPKRDIIEGGPIFPFQFLPEDKVTDFLISILRMFNLQVESDKDVENVYYIEPRDDFYKIGSSPDDFLDWTHKVDFTKQKIRPLGELLAKNYTFSYKSDNDYWNKKYLDSTGKNYGSYTKSIENDFLSNERRIEVLFGSTPMINTPSNTDIIIPQLTTKDNNGVNKVTTTSTKILIWSGLKPTTNLGQKPWDLISLRPNLNQSAVRSYNSYPFAGTVDSPFDPNWDINFYYTDFVYWNRARWTNDNIYNRYWKNFIDEISDKDSKVINYLVRLDARDINNLDFKKIYVINGHWLRLQKIVDYNSNGESLTECEFLKLKSPTKFFRRSISIIGGSNFGSATTVSNTGVVTTITESAPVNWTTKYPISGEVNTGINFNGSSNVGQNNTIGNGSVNVSIVGDENSIGNSATNISLIGSGIHVSGGVTNVNVIGTNNLIINESNVTYINGVRYINGVATSPSNVIDGGINEVISLNPDTSAVDTVDGGEDVATPIRTTTFINVINAGENYILPNIPNYGVSTINSALPTTNKSGSVIRRKGTLSLPEEIQDEVGKTGEDLNYKAI